MTYSDLQFHYSNICNVTSRHGASRKAADKDNAMISLGVIFRELAKFCPDAPAGMKDAVKAGDAAAADFDAACAAHDQTAPMSR